MRTFAALAAVLLIGLTPLAGPPRAGQPRSHSAPPGPARVSGHDGRYNAVFTAPPGALVTLRTSAADAAGGTVTETITSGYRTGR